MSAPDGMTASVVFILSCLVTATVAGLELREILSIEADIAAEQGRNLSTRELLNERYFGRMDEPPQDDRTTKHNCEAWPYQSGSLNFHPIVAYLGYQKSMSPQDAARKERLKGLHGADDDKGDEDAEIASEDTNIDLRLSIDEIDALDDHTRSVTMKLSLMLEWVDTRLEMPAQCKRIMKFEDCDSVLEKRLSVSDVIGYLWTPPVHIKRLRNAKAAALFSDSGSEGELNYCKGRVSLFGSFGVTIGCDVQYESYPFDTQRCMLEFVSTSLIQTHIDLQWKSPPEYLKSNTFLSRANEIMGESSSSQSYGNFDQRVLQVQPTNNFTEEFAGLEVMFEFRRFRRSHIVQTYLPSTLLVLASLASLYVPSDLVPGRMTLCITTTLTVMAMMTTVLDNAPSTSYLKAIDIWMITCFCYTFIDLFEYCVVLYLSRDANLWYDQIKVTKKKTKPRRKTTKDSTWSAPGDENENNEKHAKEPVKTADHELRHFVAYQIEKWSAFVFPLTFCLFSIVYSVVFLVGDDEISVPGFKLVELTRI